MNKSSDPILRYEDHKKPREAAPIKPGMQVRVHVLIREGQRERIQPFEGTIVAMRGNGLGKTFTVRRVVSGIGIERIFLLHSPVIKDIEILGAEKVRRSKLSFLRKTNVKRRKKEDEKALQRARTEKEEQLKTEQKAQKEIEEAKKKRKEAAGEESSKDDSVDKQGTEKNE